MPSHIPFNNLLMRIVEATFGLKINVITVNVQHSNTINTLLKLHCVCQMTL